MKLTAAERRRLCLMTNLAIEWESTLIDSMEPRASFGAAMPPARAKSIQDSRRNIEQFAQLRDKILAAAERTKK